MRWWLIAVAALTGATFLFEGVATSGSAATKPGVMRAQR